MRTTFTFSHKVHCCHSQKDGKGLKTASPQGLFSSPFSPPSFPSPPSFSDPSLPSKELLHGHPLKLGLELRTPPGKRHWLHNSGSRTRTALHIPTPEPAPKIGLFLAWTHPCCSFWCRDQDVRMRCKSQRLHLETHCCWTLCQCQLLLSNGSDYHCIYINIYLYV